MQPKLQAYYEQINSGKMLSTEFRILKAIIAEPRTIEFFRNEMRIAHQTATSAVSRLCDSGLVKMSGEEKHSILTYVSLPIEQYEQAEKRRMERFERWRKVGDENDFYNLLKSVEATERGDNQIEMF